MALNFPANPKRGDTITAGSRKWKFTGTAWIRVDRANQGDRGFPGATGATGATGPAGATGPVEEFVASINGLTGGITTDGLTFAFAGISVGAFGITTDGAVSFSGVTGTIQNPGGGNDAKIDISAGQFTLGRFHRLNGTSTIGDVDQASNGTRVEVGVKNQTVDVYAGQKLHLHDGVLFPESGISLGVGLTFPDGTFQSSAHAPHEFVASFNGATGAVEGVNSFNGVTGAVTTTDLTLEVAGISTEGAITAEGGIALIGNVSSSQNLKIGIPGSGFGSGPFVPNTYSFPNNKLAALDSGNNPSILVNRSTISAFEGNTELEFKRIGDFVVKSFNGVTSDVEGVNSFNGLTGAVSTTDLTLEVAGISASGGITIGGNIIDHTGTVGISGGLAITGSNELTFSGTNVSITAEGDGTNKISLSATNGLNIQSGYTQDTITFNQKYEPVPGTIIIIDRAKLATGGGEFMDVNVSVPSLYTVEIGDLDAAISDTLIKIDPTHSTSAGVTGSVSIETDGTVVETFNPNYRRHVDVATFTINASSSIATGAKTNSLYRIPYDATLTNFDVKASSIGGLTAAIRIAGPDFGDPLTSGITGCSLGIEGLTGSSTVFDQASVTAGNFVLLDIFSNDSGSTGTQAFLTFESR